MFLHNLVAGFRRIFPVGRFQAQQIKPGREHNRATKGKRCREISFRPSSRIFSGQRRVHRSRVWKRAAITEHGRAIPRVNQSMKNRTADQILGQDERKYENDGCQDIQAESDTVWAEVIEGVENAERHNMPHKFSNFAETVGKLATIFMISLYVAKIDIFNHFFLQGLDLISRIFAEKCRCRYTELCL